MNESLRKKPWPAEIRVRDTQLHDNSTGGRIYTTSGSGYEKKEYVRKDIAYASDGEKYSVKWALAVEELERLKNDT